MLDTAATVPAPMASSIQVAGFCWALMGRTPGADYI